MQRAADSTTEPIATDAAVAINVGDAQKLDFAKLGVRPRNATQSKAQYHGAASPKRTSRDVCLNNLLG